MILRWLRNPEEYPRQQSAGYTIMWKGYEEALCLYYNACCEEWARRGGRNIVCQPERVKEMSKVKLPPWLGDDELHKTHRSALLCKLPDHYEKFGWAEEISNPTVEYLWPQPVEGDDEYELRPPAYWKKKKDKPSTPTKPKQRGKQSAKKGKLKRGPRSAVAKKESAVKNQSATHTETPRRSQRLAKR